MEKEIISGTISKTNKVVRFKQHDSSSSLVNRVRPRACAELSKNEKKGCTDPDNVPLTLRTKEVKELSEIMYESSNLSKGMSVLISTAE